MALRVVSAEAELFRPNMLFLMLKICSELFDKWFSADWS